MGDERGVTVEKLFPVCSESVSEGNHLVWGWYGNVGGRELDHFMRSTAFHSWDDLVDKCMRRAGELRGPGVLGALIAGFFDGKRIAHHIGPREERIETESSIFCGTCALAATTGFESARRLAPAVDCETGVDTVLETVIGLSNGALGSPHSLWRIDPDGSRQIRVAVVPP
jgi:hypothetical protein